ncbi:hypothetical protein K503DRAFT_786611, partial [Rhizopogon vinicolor AM-OR11-026]
LTIEKEVDLIWVRYMGMVLLSVDSPGSLTDRHGEYVYRSSTDRLIVLLRRGTVVSQIFEWAGVVINAMLEVIMIARLYAMYRQSRRMLIFLTVAFLAVTLACGVISATNYSHSSMVHRLMGCLLEEFILSGIYDCIVTGASPLLLAETWILATVWEVLTLFLTAIGHWGHFNSVNKISHVLLFRNLLFFNGALPITGFARMFVLGPRLILSVREYHAERLANADVGTGMNMSAFQEHIHLSTGGDV